MKHFGYAVRPSVRPLYANTYFTWRDISLLNEQISTKLGTNIHHVIGHWVQGQRSNVKVTASEIKCTFAAEAYVATVWRQGSPVYFGVRMGSMIYITDFWLLCYITPNNQSLIQTCRGKAIIIRQQFGFRSRRLATAKLGVRWIDTCEITKFFKHNINFELWTHLMAFALGKQGFCQKWTSNSCLSRSRQKKAKRIVESGMFSKSLV